MAHTRKVIPPTLWGKMLIWLFSKCLVHFKVVKVRGFGIFLVDRKRGGQRMALHLKWYNIFIIPKDNHESHEFLHTETNGTTYVEISHENGE